MPPVLVVTLSAGSTTSVPPPPPHPIQMSGADQKRIFFGVIDARRPGRKAKPSRAAERGEGDPRNGEKRTRPTHISRQATAPDSGLSATEYLRDEETLHHNCGAAATV